MKIRDRLTSARECLALERSWDFEVASRARSSSAQKLQKVTTRDRLSFKTSALSALAERSGVVFERSSGGW